MHPPSSIMPSAYLVGLPSKICLNVDDQNLDHFGFDHLVGARWDQSERLRGSE